MMTKLTLRCLGSLAASFDDVAITAFPTDKIRALFAYLAVEADQPHRREVLAALLWPEMPQAAAMTNLRVALHRLRQTLQRAAPGAERVLHLSTRFALQIDPDTVLVDARRLRELLADCAGHSHADVRTCDACLARLAEAVALYRGEFLAGLAAGDAPEFEEWLLQQRETVHQQVMAALELLVYTHERRGNDLQAHLYASRQLALDPLREGAHRQLMRILMRRGLRSEALAQFETCRKLLWTELGIAPAGETTALYEEIRAGLGQGDEAQESASPSVPQAVPGPGRSDHGPASGMPWTAWGDTPEVGAVWGRETELGTVTHWLQQDRCRIVSILGLGGVGKTTLAAAAVQALAPYYDRVLWRSLLNAPPPDELLADFVQVLDDHGRLEVPHSLDRLLARLGGQLRAQRCLLVLDNMESVLEPGRPGELRQGYEAYAQIIQMVVESKHQSSLVLTSRERPQGLARREEDTPRVRSIVLHGLALAGAQAMLAARGIRAAPEATSALVARYSGNPLALKLVVQTVHDLFGGNVAAFLAAEAPIFDDIRTLLEQQFGRLPPLEQEVLVTLAAAREPLTVAALRSALPPAQPARAVLEALRALQRRSLIELADPGAGPDAAHTPPGFVLQNVVTEFLTDKLIDQICFELDAVTSSPESWLHRFALLRATGKEYMRASQMRLILQPIAQHLVDRWGHGGGVQRLCRLLAAIHAQVQASGRTPSYGAGNILNLLLHLGADVRGYSFAGLNVWQAYLQGKLLPQVDFRGADLRGSVFTHVFGDILDIQFGAEGELLVAGVSQGNFFVWRAEPELAAASGGESFLQRFAVDGDRATMARFHAKGELLASGDSDACVRVWDVMGGQLHLTLPPHKGSPWALAFSPDRKWLATSSGEGIIYLWDMLSGAALQRLPAGGAAVPALAFAPDGKTLAGGDVDGVVYVWRNRAHNEAPPAFALQETGWTGHGDEVHALTFDATGAVLASGSHDRTVRLWDAARGVTTHILRGHRHAVRALAAGPDGRLLASGGSDAYVCLWDMHSGQLLHTLREQEYGCATLAFRGDGQILASAGNDHAVLLWEVASGRRREVLQMHTNQVNALDFSGDGRYLASGGKDCLVRLWTQSATQNDGEEAEWRQQRTMQGRALWIRTVAFHPHEDLVASGGSDPVIRLWDIHTGRTRQELAGHGDDVETVRFSPDGQRLASASRDQTVRLWHVPSGRPIRVLQGHTDRVYTCAFSPDGKQVAGGSVDRTICLWDIDAPAGRELAHVLRGHTNGVRALQYAPGGSVLVSSGYDHTLRGWDPVTGEHLFTLLSENTTALSMAFHPHSHLLAAGMNDHTVCLWDLRRRRLLCVLRGHTGAVEGVRFSPDGRVLASASSDETIRLWDVAAVLQGWAVDGGTLVASAGVCRQVLRQDGPYAGMKIGGVTGISAAQKAALVALGAVEG